MTGNFLLYDNGTALIDVKAETERWVVFPDLLEWRNVTVEVDFAPFNISERPVVIPDMRVFASGGLQVSLVALSSILDPVYNSFHPITTARPAQLSQHAFLVVGRFLATMASMP